MKLVKNPFVNYIHEAPIQTVLRIASELFIDSKYRDLMITAADHIDMLEMHIAFISYKIKENADQIDTTLAIVKTLEKANQ
jgi:hypothetical protein